MARRSAPVAKKLVSIDPTQTSFNIPQAAVYMGLTPWQTRMLVWQGKLPARKVSKNIIILRADADAFLKALPTVNPNPSDWLARRQKASVA